MQFVQLLAALPSKQATRISIARMLDEFMVPGEDGGNSFVEYRNPGRLRRVVPNLGH